jgi:hypothetical protein
MGGFRFVTKELIGMTILLVLAFLILTHSTGFARSIAATSSGYVRAVKALQGRG